MSEIKLSESELTQIKELQDSYLSSTAKFGQLKIEQVLLQKQQDNLLALETELVNEYLKLQEKEDKLNEEIAAKYGNGTINLETGLFTAD
jgi:hypothetical protein